MLTPQEIIQRELRLRGYQQNSINTYISSLNTILLKLGENPSLESIKDFLLTIPSRNYHKQLTATVHHYFKLVLKNPISLGDLPYPKKQHTLPDVLSQEEVKAILDAATNLKHKAIISILYGCGLRVSEVINLRVKDIDSKRMVIKIVQAKGARDRYVPLHIELLALLRLYYKEYKPTGGYVFNGQGKKYNVRSVGMLIESAAKKAKILRHVHSMTLRHSAAVHMIENGGDIILVQKFLGIKNKRSAMIYKKLVKKNISIKSPLSMLYL